MRADRQDIGESAEEKPLATKPAAGIQDSKSFRKARRRAGARMEGEWTCVGRVH